MEAREAPVEEKPPQDQDIVDLVDDDEEEAESQQREDQPIDPLAYDDAHDYIRDLEERGRTRHRGHMSKRVRDSLKNRPPVLDVFVPQQVMAYASKLIDTLSQNSKAFGKNREYNHALRDLKNIHTQCDHMLHLSREYQQLQGRKQSAQRIHDLVKQARELKKNMVEGPLKHAMEFDQTWLVEWGPRAMKPTPRKAPEQDEKKPEPKQPERTLGQLNDMLYVNQRPQKTLENIVDHYKVLMQREVPQVTSRIRYPKHMDVLKSFQRKNPGSRTPGGVALNIFQWYAQMEALIPMEYPPPVDRNDRIAKGKRQIRTMLQIFERFRKAWEQANRDEPIDYGPSLEEGEGDEEDAFGAGDFEDFEDEGDRTETDDELSERAHIDVWKDIKGDLEQGFQRGGVVTRWPNVIEEIMNRLPLDQHGLTQAEVNKAFQQNFYNLFYQRYKGRGYQVRPSDMFQTPIDIPENKQFTTARFHQWNKKLFSFLNNPTYIRGKKKHYMRYIINALQDNDAYDRFVSQFGESMGQPDEDEPEFLGAFKNVVRELELNPPESDVFAPITSRLDTAIREKWDVTALQNTLDRLDTVSDQGSPQYKHMLLNALRERDMKSVRDKYTPRSLEKVPETLMLLLQKELLKLINKQRGDIRKHFLEQPLSPRVLHQLENFRFPEHRSALHETIRQLHEMIIETSREGIKQQEQLFVAPKTTHQADDFDPEDIPKVEAELQKVKEYLDSLEYGIKQVKKELTEDWNKGIVPESKIESYTLAQYIIDQADEGGALQEMIQEQREHNHTYHEGLEMLRGLKLRAVEGEIKEPDPRSDEKQEEEKSAQVGVVAIPSPQIPPSPASVRIVSDNSTQIGSPSESLLSYGTSTTIAYEDPGGFGYFQQQLDLIDETEGARLNRAGEFDVIRPQELEPGLQERVDGAHFPMSHHEEALKEQVWDRFLTRKGYAVLEKDFYYDRAKQAIRPITKARKTYTPRIQRVDRPYQIPANHFEEIAYVERPSAYSEFDPEQVTERFLKQQRKTSPAFKASKKATAIGDFIHVKLYPHSIHFVFLKKPQRPALEIMAKRIIEQTASSANCRLLSSKMEKGKKIIGTVIASRDLARMKPFHVQNIIARSRDSHFILRFDSSGGAIHQRYDRNFHLL